MSGKLNEETKILFFVVILFVNIRFFVTWLVVFFKEFTAKIRRDHTENYYKLFGRCILVQPYLKYASRKVK